MDGTAEPAFLFSYGTLQDGAVQRALFGRELTGTPQSLPGFAVSWLEITDPEVISTSGQVLHPVLKPTGRADDVVAGTAFAVTRAELAKTDAYEGDNYRRVSVPLIHGEPAWVYVIADEAR